MKSNSEPIPAPLNFNSVISSQDFPNPYLPLPSELVLETLLRKARCLGPSSDGFDRVSQSSDPIRKENFFVPDAVSQEPPRPCQPSVRMVYANVETFCKIRSWLILHQTPQVMDSRDYIDSQIARVTNSIHLLASALLLHRCWLYLVDDAYETTPSTSSKLQKISSGTRYIISDIIQAIHSALPNLIHKVFRDDQHNHVVGEPFIKKRRRQKLPDSSLLDWLEPHLVDWNLRCAMDQFLFRGTDELRSQVIFSAELDDAFKFTKSDSCCNRYQHFIRTFRQFSWNKERKLNIHDDSATRDNAETNMVFLLLQQLKEIRMVVQQSIEAYNDFRSIFCAVFDAPEGLSSIPLQQLISILLSQSSHGGNLCFSEIEENSPFSTLGSITSPNEIYLQQKRLLDLSWKLSLQTRLTLPPLPRYSSALTEHCRSHSMFCSAVSIACITTLLLDGCAKVHSEVRLQTYKLQRVEETSDVQFSSATLFSPDSVLDMILQVVNDFELNCLSRFVTSDSQSSLEKEPAKSNDLTTKRELQIAACALLQTLDDASPTTVVRSFASLFPAISDLSLGKVSTIPYYCYIDQTAIPVDGFADALGCTDADFNVTKSVFDDSKSILPAHMNPNSCPRSRNGNKPCPTSLSLFVDNISQATVVLATIEKGEGRALQCYATPIVITDEIELTEWAVSTTFVKDVHPSTQLLALLDEYTTRCVGLNRHWQDIVYPIINRALLRLLQERDKTDSANDAPVTVITTGSSSGYVQMRSEITADMQLCKAMVALYYIALEAILYCDKVQSACNETSSKKKYVGLESFHQSLLACCCLCVTKANAFAKRFRASPFLKRLTMTSILFITGSGPYEFLKVSNTFLRSLSVNSVAHDKLASPLISPLPALLRNHIEQVEIHTIDSLLWLRNRTLPSGTSFTDKILEYQKKMAEQKSDDDVPCLWPPNVLAPKLQEELEDAGVTTYIAPTYPTPEHPEYDDLCAVLQVIQKLLLLARNRLVALCQQLQVNVQSPVFTQVWVTFRHVLRNHVELFFDRHIDQWILCTLYGVSRSVKYQPELKFAKIIEAYVTVREQELGPIMCQRIVRHIRIAAPTATDEGMGNIISLYNKVFVPKMKDFLLNSESLRRCTMKLTSLQHQ
jgi:Retinoblastoma-associated protein B domain/Retinoblastoma-associated protein A domain